MTNKTDRTEDRKKGRIIEDIYDILFETRFNHEARKRFNPIWRRKNMEVNYTEGKEKYILIGKKYKLTLTRQ